MKDWKSDYEEYDGNKIHYHHDGKNKPIILLHGVMDNGLCFSPVAQKLSENYHTIMTDARGHGLTEVSEDVYSYDVMARDIAMLIKDLKLEKPQIIGHSMGAAMATLVASKYPKLVSRIILEDPAFIFRKSNKFLKGFAKLIIKNLILPLLFRSSYEKLLEKGRKKKTTWSEEELQPWAKSKVLFKKNNPNMFLGLIDDETDWMEVIKNISCPILLITSDKGMTKDDKAQEIVDSSKDCKWVKINGAGHNIRREQFERYMEEVQDFLLP
ncbi:MAG: alpha/beta hydrolase [archaeon]|nr:alpha/beta hydrolase [archaeon]